jgi:hypothetical protein
VCSNLISWSSKKQPTILRYSTKEEYKTLANGAVEAMRVSFLLTEFRVTQRRARTKQLEIDFHFVCESIAEGALQIKFTSSNDQLADVFTKLARR